MKLRRVAVQNVRSFLERQELQLPGDISILIGPNGGGKTNLLDVVFLALRLFVVKSWIPRHAPTDDAYDRYEWANNDSLSMGALDRHSAATTQDQVIELDIEVTKTDVDNMARLRTDADAIQNMARTTYVNYPTLGADTWELEGIGPGTIFSFRIVNGTLVVGDAVGADTFRRYLETYEVHNRVREEYDKLPLSMPMLSLPTSRSASTVSTSISLAGYDEYDHKRSVDAASSRGSGSIPSLAIGRLASRYRSLLERDDGRANLTFRDDDSIKRFTTVLQSLGYDWELRCTNALRNQYDVILKKHGTSFPAGSASSGEREILTYLFAVYALNVRDALIVVDEPEMHLHPRWQQMLLGMFETLSRDTGNQFIMATHSPVFVSPLSIQYVSRVYAENQRSRVVRLGESRLPDRKHLFSIVNSQNNERILFADHVVLVEGISDRIFFEVLLRHLKVGEGTGKVYEVVSVGGKSLFAQYEKLLTACHVPYSVIADLDYVRDIGTDELRGFFSTSGQSIKRNVLDDPASVDGATLADRLDEAVKTGSTAGLADIWEYVKGRHSRRRPDLNDAEQAVLKAFIQGQRSHQRFILLEGALEAYLPSDHRGKDLEKLIRLTSSTDFWEQVPTEGKGELQEIATAIGQLLSATGSSTSV